MALKLVPNDYISDFDTLSQNNNTCNDTWNRYRNIETLMVEIYEIKNNLNPPIMEFMFEGRNNMSNPRHLQGILMKRKRIVKMGLEFLNYRSPQL